MANSLFGKCWKCIKTTIVCNWVVYKCVLVYVCQPVLLDVKSANGTKILPRLLALSAKTAGMRRSLMGPANVRHSVHLTSIAVGIYRVGQPTRSCLKLCNSCIWWHRKTIHIHTVQCIVGTCRAPTFINSVSIRCCVLQHVLQGVQRARLLVRLSAQDVLIDTLNQRQLQRRLIPAPVSYRRKLFPPRVATQTVLQFCLPVC